GRAWQAAGDAAERLRGKGRRAAQHDLPLLDMALPAHLRDRSIQSTLHRTRGPLPDPAWVAGYRQAVTARDAERGERGGREAGS
ncbi:MAG: hypothetical protein ACRDNZ_08390, partial [Streptosporangiaceae bacterium]